MSRTPILPKGSSLPWGSFFLSSKTHLCTGSSLLFGPLYPSTPAPTPPMLGAISQWVLGILDLRTGDLVRGQLMVCPWCRGNSSPAGVGNQERGGLRDLATSMGREHASANHQLPHSRGHEEDPRGDAEGTQAAY